MSEPIHSTKWNIQLLEVKPESYAGISKDQNIVLLFPDKESRIALLSADQGKGKTSILKFIERITGSSDRVPNAINKIDHDVKGELKFINTATNTVFTARETRTTFTVKQEQNGVVSDIKKPFDFLQKALGPVGTSPMFLKKIEGKKQIEWIRKLYRFSSEEINEEQKIDSEYKSKFTRRTDVNRDVKRLHSELLESKYFKWDNENKTFVHSEIRQQEESRNANNSIDKDELTRRFEEANKKSKIKTQYTETINQLNAQEKSVRDEIKEIELRLKQKQEQLNGILTRLENGHKFLEKVSTADAELEELQVKVAELVEVKASEMAIANDDRKLSEYESFVTEQIDLNAEIDELRIKKKEFVARFTPSIEGLEIIVDDGSIDNEKQEGIYYKGHTIAELSESELWGLYIELCRVQGVNILCIDNVNSLGTNAIEILNEFAASGGYVFCSAMERTQFELKATFHKKIN